MHLNLSAKSADSKNVEIIVVSLVFIVRENCFVPHYYIKDCFIVLVWNSFIIIYVS